MNMPATNLDTIFGTTVIPIADANITVRRMLTRAQTRTIGQARRRVSEIQKDLTALTESLANIDEATMDATEIDKNITKAEELDDALAEALWAGLEILLVNPQPDIAEMSTDALANIFLIAMQQQRAAVINIITKETASPTVG